jgi:hypothetical protein
MVDRRFFPSWTSELPIFFAEIVFVIFSSKLTHFVRATAAGSNTDTANGATADDAINAPLARRPPRAAMLLEILLRHLCKNSTDV